MTDPLSISWSRLRAHEECKQKAHLIGQGKRGPATNLRNYFHGMVVDTIMKTWLSDPHRRAGDMTAMVRDAIHDVQTQARDTGDGVVRWRTAGDQAELTQFCIDLVERLEPILRVLVLPYPFDVGYRFKVPVKIPDLTGTPTLVYLHGEMDLKVQHPDFWAVWDLKGTRDDQYWRKVLGQLTFYDLAGYAIHGTPSGRAGLIQPMCTEPVLEATIGPDERNAMWARIVRYAHDVWSQDVSCKDSTGGCDWCEVRHACPRFQPEGTIASALRQAATGPGAAT